MSRQMPWHQLNDYQDMAWSYDVGAKLCDKRLVHALGLAGEVGEVIEHIKKHLRDGSVLDLAELRAELSDVMWYHAVLARDYGIALGDIADHNLRKLADRRRRNVLSGRGDHR